MVSDFSKVLKKELYCPRLEDIQTALQKGLKNNFTEVTVEVVDCPDLSVEPFNLACKGIGGSTAILDVGGPPYLLPNVLKDKVYDLKDIAKEIGMESCLLLGAGAGPWPSVGKNCEMMANVFIDKDTVISKTHIAKLKDDGSTDINVDVLPASETRFALMANLFACEGSRSKVLKVHCKNRIGVDNFVISIRNTLEKEFKDKYVGLGGAFLLQRGKALQHVMPAFSSTPIHTEEELNQWLSFYEMSAPLVAVGTMMSSDIPTFDLRVQHFHSFSNHNEAGHYHQDTTPNDVEYLGYFNTGQYIYRIDQPAETHQFGRD